MDAEKKALILVADDQLLIQEFFSVILDKLNYGYLMADDGHDAVEKARNNKPALIFMDIQMPDKNGYEAAKEIRDMGLNIPIIATTAGISKEERESCFNADINEVLTKPLKRAAVERILQKWIKADYAGTPTEATDISPGTKNAVFDPADLLDTFMHEEETALSLLTRFIERTEKQLENFQAFEKANDWKSARIDAHMIRGASLTMGGSELGKAAGILEHAIIDAATDEVNSAYATTCKAFAIFKTEAEKYILSRR